MSGKVLTAITAVLIAAVAGLSVALCAANERASVAEENLNVYIKAQIEALDYAYQQLGVEYE